MAILYRSKTEIEGIRRAGQVVMEILAVLREAVRPGVTTGELDAIAARELARREARSNFKGYVPRKGIPPFPGVICASVNDEIVHGIPGRRVLQEGDIIAVDFGAIVDGWHGDSAVTLPVGAVTAEAERLLTVTREALWRGIAQVRPGHRVSDISKAVQGYVEGQGCAVVRQYVGHGIGRALHEEPSVPNYFDPDPRVPDPRLRPGMVICIEPMVNLGAADTRELRDRWTVASADGSLSAHFEHTVAVTSGEPDVLTAHVASPAA
ncbi:MAG TPA: type I methionyl aminopeptidase [Ktedonobacterales bacterium]|jgi:methionyl aminopeptidase